MVYVAWLDGATAELMPVLNPYPRETDALPGMNPLSMWVVLQSDYIGVGRGGITKKMIKAKLRKVE